MHMNLTKLIFFFVMDDIEVTGKVFDVIKTRCGHFCTCLVYSRLHECVEPEEGQQHVIILLGIHKNAKFASHTDVVLYAMMHMHIAILTH